MTICTFKSALEIASAVFALAAALSWSISAWHGRYSLFETPIGTLDHSLRLQSLFNAGAALCAAVAAVCQITVTWLPVCRGFG
jgi:hypothetical protein